MGSGTPVVIADTIERLADEIPPLSGDGVSVVIDARGIGAAGVHPVEDVGAPGRILGFALIEGLGVDGAAVVWNSGGPSRQARSGPALTAHRSERGWVRLHPRWSVDENDPAGTITVPVPLHQDPVRLFPG